MKRRRYAKKIAIIILGTTLLLSGSLNIFAESATKITHGFVEEIFQECINTSDAYSVLSRYNFCCDDWLKIKNYFEDNLKCPISVMDKSTSFFRARSLFLNLVNDIIGELEYERIVEATFIKERDQQSTVDNYFYVNFGNGISDYIYVEFASTLIDPRLTSITDIAKDTKLVLYLGNNNRTVKIMLSPNNQAPLPSQHLLLTQQSDSWEPALTDEQTTSLRSACERREVQIHDIATKKCCRRYATV